MQRLFIALMIIIALVVMIGCSSNEASGDITSSQRNLREAAIEKGESVIKAAYAYIDWYGTRPMSLNALDSIPNYSFVRPTDSTYSIEYKSVNCSNLLFGRWTEMAVVLRANLDNDPAEDVVRIYYGGRDKNSLVEITFDDLKAFN